MSILSIILAAIGLSMDAFAVSLTVGINSRKEEKLRMALKSGVFFGAFQGLMPLIGWALGISFSGYIESIDHWIAFVLLMLIGGKMIYESLKDHGDEEVVKDYSNKKFLLLAIATSIDALAVGISFACLNVNIVLSASVIALVTFLFSFIAVYIGKVLGNIVKNRAEILGGLILGSIGIKILLEHIFFS